MLDLTLSAAINSYAVLNRCCGNLFVMVSKISVLCRNRYNMSCFTVFGLNHVTDITKKREGKAAYIFFFSLFKPQNVGLVVQRSRFGAVLRLVPPVSFTPNFTPSFNVLYFFLS